MPLPSLTLVLGGASCGKSAFAESLCFQTNKPRTYIATAQAFDTEMRLKISKHQAQRGPDWHTIEAPNDICGALAQVPDGHVVLFDCATLWLTNIMLSDADVTEATNVMMQALKACRPDVIVVSNEVGHGIVPESSLGRRFRNEQGRLNQILAAQAGLVVHVIAGLPQVLKGSLP